MTNHNTIVDAGAFIRPVPAPTKPERFEVIVIGGGQAGLSVGYHLKRRGMRFVILDATARDRRRLAEALGLAAPVLAGRASWPRRHAVPRPAPTPCLPRTRWRTTSKTTPRTSSCLCASGVRAQR